VKEKNKLNRYLIMEPNSPDEAASSNPMIAKTGGAARVRVLIVAPSLDILGGQAVQAERLVNHLGAEPTLEIGFLPINPRLPGVLRKLQSIKYLRTIVTSIWYCASLLRRVPKYDVVHAFSASYFSFVLAPTPAILTAKLFGKKVLLNYHSGEADDHLTRWSRTAIPTIRLADQIAVPSDYLVKVFARHGLRARAIFNLIGAETFRFRERRPLRPLFLSNRNLERHYGVDRVLRAFALIQQCIPDARLTVAGDGSQRRSLEQLAGSLALRQVEFVGQIDQDRIFGQYDAADIYLNGSEIDNQPLSLLEAFACGLPVITTDAGGIPDLVSHERTGLMVKRGDHEGLAREALRLLKEQSLAEGLTREAKLECQRYSWESVRRQWLELYAELAGGERQ
jgi:glycosyltransferase involved in cell wall biosynthesis